MERKITINIPENQHRAMENPSDVGDFITANTVYDQVERVITALKGKGEITDGDEIRVVLTPSDKVRETDPSREGTVETYWREDEDGTGAIDSTRIGFKIELADNANS